MATSTTPGRSMRWQDWLSLVLGIWLFVSPWLLDFHSQIPAESWNFFAVGAAFAVFAAVGLGLRSHWEEWINLALGIWLILSPWVLFYNDNARASGDAMVIGAIVTVLSIWAIGVRNGGPADAAAPHRLSH